MLKVAKSWALFLILSSWTSLTQAATINGEIIDSNGHGIENVSIFALDQNNINPTPDFPYNSNAHNVESDSAGNFSFINLPVGEYFLFSTKRGYRSEYYEKTGVLSKAKLIVISNDNEAINLNSIQLTRRGVIEGTVVDINNNPLPNVFVEAIDKENYENEHALNRTITNDNGEFKFIDLSEFSNFSNNDTYRLYFRSINDSRKYEYFDNATSIKDAKDIIVTRNQVITLPIVLGDIGTANVSGTITNKLGEAISNATIFLEYKRGGSNTWVNAGGARSDINGSFILNKIQENDYRITINAEGYINKTHPETITLKAGDSLENIDIQLSINGSISGEIAINNQDFINAKVFAYRKTRENFHDGADSYIWDLAKTTDANGQFLIKDLVAGIYRLKVIKGNTFEFIHNTTTIENAQDFEVVANQETKVGIISIDLSNTGNVTGKVTDLTTGESLKNILIGAYHNDHGIPYGWSLVTEELTDSDGRFKFTDLTAYKYIFRAKETYAGSYFSGRSIATDVIAGNETIANIKLQAKIGNIQGAIRHNDNKPAKGLKVLLYTAEYRGGEHPSLWKVSFTTTTNNNGLFSFKNLSTREYYKLAYENTDGIIKEAILINIDSNINITLSGDGTTPDNIDTGSTNSGSSGSGSGSMSQTVLAFLLLLLILRSYRIYYQPFKRTVLVAE